MNSPKMVNICRSLGLIVQEGLEEIANAQVQRKPNLRSVRDFDGVHTLLQP